MTARVVGIDLSLTKTGIGIVRADGTADGELIAHVRPMPKAKREKAGLSAAPTLHERRTCLNSALSQVAVHIDGAALVVIYGAYTGAVGQGDARHDVLALWWRVVGFAMACEVPIAVVTDSAARKALTGKGSHGDRETNKHVTALSVRELYPDVALPSNDVSDAIAAAHLGAVALDFPVKSLARYRDVKWSEWPELPSPYPADRSA